jgi:hypothetical protein
MVASPIRRDDRDGFRILQSDNLSFVILLSAIRPRSELGKPPHLLTQKGSPLLPVAP